MNFFSSESPCVRTAALGRSFASWALSDCTWPRTDSIVFNMSAAALRSFCIWRSSAVDAAISWTGVRELGSRRTSSGCENVSPSTTSFTVYRPGGISTVMFPKPGASRVPSASITKGSSFRGLVRIRGDLVGSLLRSQ